MATSLSFDSSNPLTRLENGVYRVSGSRIPLVRAIELYNDGATPEEIVDSFDALRLAGVYSLIGYYLKNRAEVDSYIQEQEAEGDKKRLAIEATQTPRPGFREELLRRQALLEKDNVEAGR